jgi:hypothetical protein
MADLVALITLAVLFPLSILYIHGCEHLRGGKR